MAHWNNIEHDMRTWNLILGLDNISILEYMETWGMENADFTLLDFKKMVAQLPDIIEEESEDEDTGDNASETDSSETDGAGTDGSETDGSETDGSETKDSVAEESEAGRKGDKTTSEGGGNFDKTGSGSLEIENQNEGLGSPNGAASMEGTQTLAPSEDNVLNVEEKAMEEPIVIGRRNNNRGRGRFLTDPTGRVMSIRLFDGKYACTWKRCSTLSKRSSQINRHYQEKHLGSRLFVCKTCAKSFGRKEHLERHQKICAKM